MQYPSLKIMGMSVLDVKIFHGLVFTLEMHEQKDQMSQTHMQTTGFYILLNGFILDE
jgi:hypothetical protein